LKAHQRSARVSSTSSFVEHLKGKSRRRRRDLAGLAEAEAARRPRRNDLLPRLELALVPLDALKLPAREVRKLNAAHVREVASAIGALGFWRRSWLEGTVLSLMVRRASRRQGA
jgi:hypothetical protein